MIIKVELVINISPEFIKLYHGDPRSISKIVLDEIESDIEYGHYLKIISTKLT